MMPMLYLYENSVENDIKIFEIPTTRKFSSKRVRKFKIYSRYVIINFPTIGFTLYIFIRKSKEWEFRKKILSFFTSVHGHPEFLGAHPYPHCVLMF